MKQRRLEWFFAGAAVFFAFAIVAVNSALADCGGCGKDMGKGKAHAACSCMVPGAEVAVTNIENGVTITITAKDKEAVRKIQEMAADYGKAALKGCPFMEGKKERLYECGMGPKCYHGPKTGDGKCPKCGMKLKKSKS
ncbi:MAG: hypothetical protein WC943_05905 [Elusimicrobiota bacterium]